VVYEECNDMNLMMSKGFLSVPMLEVDEEIMDFNNAIKWLKEI
jgi:hypothetical protein